MGVFKEMVTEIIEDLDNLEAQEIRHLINIGTITETDVRDYYNNEWWEETP